MTKAQSRNRRSCSEPEIAEAISLEARERPAIRGYGRQLAAARRAYWKGYLKLSLVTCPIALYPASSQAEKTHFHQINRNTGNLHTRE